MSHRITYEQSRCNDLFYSNIFFSDNSYLPNIVFLIATIFENVNESANITFCLIELFCPFLKPLYIQSYHSLSFVTPCNPWQYRHSWGETIEKNNLIFSILYLACLGFVLCDSADFCHGICL